MGTVLAMLCFALPCTAAADVIPAGMPRPVCAPISCPTGSTSFSTGHGACPRDCTPWAVECSAAGTCEPGLDCVHARLCVEEGFMGRTRGPIVRGECAPDGTCAVGECWDRPRCVPSTTGSSSTTSSSSSMSSGSCTASPPRASRGVTLAVIGAAFLLAWAAAHRRRRAMRASTARRPLP
ncbi:MAG: hypothetical protein U0234_15030 [Sandaracinus sp.]